MNNTQNTFDTQSYKEQMKRFPDISFEEYQTITDLDVRKDIAKKNKIIQTDSYNRTMTHIRWERWKKIESYSLSMRKSTNWEYNVIDGIRGMLTDILGMPITQAELDFAQAYYEDQKNKWGNGYFNAEMRQEVIDNGWFMPLEIKAVADGTVMKPKEPSMIVTWPGELAAVYEPLFLRAFFKSAIATDAHVIDQILGEGRIAEFGKRSWPNEEYHLDAVEANIVGGWLKSTSNDTAWLVFPQVKTWGTTAHRYFSAYPTEDEAFLEAIEKTENIALLVDLADSYQWIDKIVALKKKYRDSGKTIWMRLDSGDLADQAVYGLTKLKENNMLDPKQDKIVVADISNVSDIIKVENAVKAAGFEPKDFIVYGLGGLLVARNKTRDALSAGYKLINTEDGPTGKLSNDEWKEPIPGIPNVEIRDNERVIVQEDEKIEGERLLKKVYDKGEFLYEGNDMEAIDQARLRLKETFELSQLESKKSPRTTKIHKYVRNKIAGNLTTEELENNHDVRVAI